MLKFGFHPFYFSEGFIAAEDLASSLEKAWVGLHIQVRGRYFSFTCDVVYPSIHFFRLMALSCLLMP